MTASRFIQIKFREGAVPGLLIILVFSVFTIWNLDYWPGAVAEVGLYLGAVSLLCAGGLGFQWTLSVSLLAAMSIWVFIQVAFHLSIYSFATNIELLRWIAYWCAAWSGIQAFTTASAVRKLMRVLLFVALAVSLLGVLKEATASDKILWLWETPYSKNAIGVFLNRNYYAAFIELVLPIAMWEALKSERYSLCFAASGAFLFACVILSASRTGWILALCEVLIFYALFFRSAQSKFTRRRLILIFPLMIIGAMLTIGWASLELRFQQDNELSDRLAFFGSAVQMIRARPIWGFGMGTWRLAYPSFAAIDVGGIVNHAHNDWLEWTCEGGLPFGIMSVLLGLRGVLLAFRNPWGAGVAVVCLHSVVDFPLQKLPIFLAFIMLISAMESLGASHVGYRRRRKVIGVNTGQEVHLQGAKTVG